MLTVPIVEQEAVERWCPYSSKERIYFYGGLSNVSKCLGSGCMAWAQGEDIKEMPAGYCVKVVHGSE